MADRHMKQGLRTFITGGACFCTVEELEEIKRAAEAGIEYHRALDIEMATRKVIDLVSEQGGAWVNCGAEHFLWLGTHWVTSLEETDQTNGNGNKLYKAYMPCLNMTRGDKGLKKIDALLVREIKLGRDATCENCYKYLNERT